MSVLVEDAPRDWVRVSAVESDRLSGVLLLSSAFIYTYNKPFQQVFQKGTSGLFIRKNIEKDFRYCTDSSITYHNIFRTIKYFCTVSVLFSVTVGRSSFLISEHKNVYT